MRRGSCACSGVTCACGEITGACHVYTAKCVRFVVGRCRPQRGQPVVCCLLAGVGLSAVNLSCQVVLQQHFNRNRSIATAVAMTGKSIGLIVGPPLIQCLIDVFGWRGALLVFSAVFLNTFALSLGFRPPRKALKKARGFKAVLRKIFDFSMKLVQNSTNVTSVSMLKSKILRKTVRKPRAFCALFSVAGNRATARRC